MADINAENAEPTLKTRRRKKRDERPKEQLGLISFSLFAREIDALTLILLMGKIPPFRVKKGCSHNLFKNTYISEGIDFPSFLQDGKSFRKKYV